MTQEDRELLIKDLCARLPYKIRVSTPDKPICAINSIPSICSTIVIDGSGEKVYPLKDIKPYLFPLSSMTDEQRKELEELYLGYYVTCQDIDDDGYWDENVFVMVPGTETDDWCNKNHFDYRGLIPKGLALDATGKNIY